MRRRENRELLKLIIQPVEIGNRAITSEAAQSDLTLLLILFKLYSPTGFISPSGIKANELKQKITEIEKIVCHFLLFYQVDCYHSLLSSLGGRGPTTCHYTLIRRV